MTDSDAIIDMITERPHNFKFSGRSFSIRPITLGKTLLLSRYNALLFSVFSKKRKKDIQKVLLDLCEEQRKIVNQIIAIYITSNSQSLFDDEYMSELTKFIDTEMSDVQKCTLLQLYYEEKPISHFTKLMHIDEEKEKQKKALKAKDPSTSLQVGGASILGNLIDVACERYGWSYQYVLWGISYNALRVMMSDIIQTIYLTDKERARAHINDDGRILHGENQQDIDYFKTFCNN